MEQFEELLRAYEMPPIRFGDSFERLQAQLDILDRIIHDLHARQKAIVVKINSLTCNSDELRAQEMAERLRSLCIPSIEQFELPPKVCSLVEERERVKADMLKLSNNARVAALLGTLDTLLSERNLGESESVIKQLDVLELRGNHQEQAKALRKTFIQLVKEQLI